METSILKLANDNLFEKDDERVLSLISASLSKKNISISNIVVSDKQAFLSSLDYLTTNSTSIILVCDINLFEFVKDKVCEIKKCELQFNQFAKTGIDAYFKKVNEAPTKQAMQNYYLPSQARCILNLETEFVGFMFNYNSKEIFVIPSVYKEAKAMFNGSVLPLLTKEFGRNYFSINIKTFSISKDEINSVIDRLKASKKVLIDVFSDGLVCEIIIKFKTELDREYATGVAYKIYEQIGRYIFTDESNNLEDIVCDILKVQNKSISIFEDISCGTLTSTLISSSNFEDFMLEKAEIIATNKTKIYHASTEQNEEEFIKTLLMNNFFDNNVCVVNLKAKNEKHAYYIGIMINENAEVYKIKLLGEDDEIITKLNQTTFYYLIKKLKQKHF